MPAQRKKGADAKTKRRPRTNADALGLDHLRAFLEFLRLETQDAVAEEIGVSQETVHRYLKRVQEHFGHGLFEPGPGARLTTRGKMVEEAATMAVGVLSRARDRLSPSGPVLRLGFVRSVRLLVERALRSETMRRSERAFAVRLREMSNEALGHAVATQELDIAICYATDDLARRTDLEESLVVHEPAALVVPERAWINGEISVEALDGLADITIRNGLMPEVERAKRGFYGEHGLQVETTIACDSVVELLAYTGADLGYGLVPALWGLTNHPGVVFVPLPSFPTVKIAAYSLGHLTGWMPELREKLSSAAAAALQELSLELERPRSHRARRTGPQPRTMSASRRR